MKNHIHQLSLNEVRTGFLNKLDNGDQTLYMKLPSFFKSNIKCLVLSKST